MKKFYRTIIYTKTPLKSQFRYKDKFQILPIDTENAPSSPYNKHFPIFLEYYIEFDKNENPKNIDFFEDLTAQQVVEFEIINLLSVLSNHRFFKYNYNNHQWAVVTPNAGFESLKEKEKELFDNQYSSWTIGVYRYPGLAKDLIIENFSEKKFKDTPLISPYYKYFTENPIESEQKEITFPETINSSLENYYKLSKKTYKKVKSAISLICDGIDISDYKRSLAFLSFTSAIEALVSLEHSDKEIKFECPHCKRIEESPYNCPKCGKPIWGIKAKFKEFLKKFVAGSDESAEKYNKIYNIRSKITHQGQLFISDYEFSLDNLEKKENDYIMKLETLQLARLSLTNWLRYEGKASR